MVSVAASSWSEKSTELRSTRVSRFCSSRLWQLAANSDVSRKIADRVHLPGHTARGVIFSLCCEINFRPRLDLFSYTRSGTTLRQLVL